MIDFENVYHLVENSSHETAFNREECEAMWKIASALNKGARIVEIGVQFGRSTTVLGLAAKELELEFVAIDPWVEVESKEARAHVVGYQIEELGLPIKLWDLTSVEAENIFPEGASIDLVHIDGEHTHNAVLQDCELWLPKVKDGGFAMFDDYGHNSLPEVIQAVSEYMSDHGEWNFVGQYGNKLGIFQKSK